MEGLPMTHPIIPTTRRGDVTFHPNGRIDLVDPRYFAQELPTLLRDAGTQRVLVYYGLNTFSQTRALAMLRACMRIQL